MFTTRYELNLFVELGLIFFFKVYLGIGKNLRFIFVVYLTSVSVYYFTYSLECYDVY